MFWTAQILRWDYVFSYWLTTTKPCHCLYKKGLCSCEPLSCFIHPFITYLPSELAGPTFVALHSHQIFNERIFIPKREYSGDIKWFMEEEYSWKKFRYLLHNTSKDQRGLRGYRRQHHDTKWNIYSRRNHLIQSNICIYIRATNPTTHSCTLHYSPWPFSSPCFPLFWLKMGTQLVVDHKNILYTAFVIALGSLFKWKNGILGIY